MKNYYLYLDPDDGILYVLKDCKTIAPVKTSASFDPKTIRIKDGYLQIRDFETDDWKFICDENGLPVSLKGPAGDHAVLNLTKDSFSVLIGLDSETDGNLLFTTYLNYYLDSDQEIIDCEENIEVECSDKITVYLHNETPLTVKITIVIPAGTPLTDIEDNIKLKTVGLPFAGASIYLLPNHLSKEEWEIMECIPSVIKVKDDVATTNTFTVITGPTNSSLPSGYVLLAMQGDTSLSYEKGTTDKDYIFTIDSTNTSDDIVVTLSQSGTEISKRVIQFLHESKYKPIDPEIIDDLLNTVEDHTDKLNSLDDRLEHYQTIVDHNLHTSNHTIVDAINELYLNQLMGGSSIKGSYIQGLNYLIYRDLNLLPGEYMIRGTVTCSVGSSDPYNSACIYVAQSEPTAPVNITEDGTVYKLGNEIIVEDGYKVYLVFASSEYIDDLLNESGDLFVEAPVDCTITVSNLQITQVRSTMGLRDTIVNYISVPVESANYINANTVLTKKALLARQEFSLDYVQLEQDLDQDVLKELYKEILLNPNKNIAPDCQFIKIENVDGVLNPALPTLQELYDSGVSSSSLDSFYRYISENNQAYIYITDMDYITTEARWDTV